MGDVMDHEGIVLRHDKLFGPKPVKITGEFIVGNLGGGFGQVNEEEEPEVDLEIVDAAEADPQPTGAGTKTIALVPGAFKPPHKGHLKMVEQYANEAEKVIVLISRPTKAGRRLPNGREITAGDSLKMWQVLAGHLPNVEIKISDHASPITATYEFIGKNGPLEAGTEVILGVCTKGGDVERFKQAENYVKEDVILRPVESCAVEPVQHGPRLYATIRKFTAKRRNAQCG